MLCESLFHLLVEEGVLSHQTAIEAIEGVTELIEDDLRPAKVRAAAVLANAIRESFLLKDRRRSGSNPLPRNSL
jgi:hypothetical protein